MALEGYLTIGPPNSTSFLVIYELVRHALKCPPLLFGRGVATGEGRRTKRVAKGRERIRFRQPHLRAITRNI